MAKYFYIDNDGKTIYIKNIDFQNEKLTFTENKDDAYYEDRGSFYEEAQRDQLKRLFSSEYPQVKKIRICSSYE